MSKNPNLRASWLKAMAHHRDVEGVYRHAIFKLRASKDPELRVLARILSRKIRTGVSARFFATKPVRGRGRPAGSSKPVTCQIVGRDKQRREVSVPRSQIALMVHDLCHADEQFPRGKAIADTALFYGITEKQVRDCYDEYREELDLHADLFK